MCKCIYFLLSLLIILSSCREPDFKEAKEIDNNCRIILNVKYSKGIFSSFPGFELRLINTSADTLKNCSIIFDEKYKHTLNGLHTKGKGMIKSDNFLNGDTIVIPFHDDIDNLIFFNVPEGYSIPNRITIECNNCRSNWTME